MSSIAKERIKTLINLYIDLRELAKKGIKENKKVL